jgi:N-acetylglucosaminyl-diphospho-decaprenol L-rhamnosyltransferase
MTENRALEAHGTEVLINGEEIALSLVVLSWNTREITLACIDSILSNPPDVAWELIVIDNASTDGSADALANKFGSIPHVRLVRNEKNLGFTGGNNQGIDMAMGRVIGLLNSDVMVGKGSLSALYRFLVGRSDVAVVGPTLTREDGRPTTSFGYFPTAWRIFTTAFLPGWMWGNARRALGVIPDRRMTEPMEVDYVSGAAFFVKRQVIDRVGKLDAETFFAYFEETDWCLRIKKAGWKVVFLPAAQIIHLEGKSFETLNEHRRLKQYESAKKFFRKHYSEPILLWYQFCTVVGSLVKVAYFGLRMLVQPSSRERLVPHYRWNAFVFELWRRGLGMQRGTGD